MSPGILGKKIGMTQIFRPDGQVVPVTLLKAGPCMVVQRKTPATDGYDAVQLGLLEFVKPARINKPSTGHLKKAGVEGAKFIREFKLNGGNDLLGGPLVRIRIDGRASADELEVVTPNSSAGLLARSLLNEHPHRRLDQPLERLQVAGAIRAVEHSVIDRERHPHPIAHLDLALDHDRLLG